MKVINPATEEVLRDIDEDRPASVRAKAAAARGVQPAWATVPLIERLAAIRRFDELLAQRREELAALLTAEMGKPITQSRNELAAMAGRLGFFLEHTAAALADEVVARLPGPPPLEERIRYEPLGVVANISAWNYPYFVGSNVFIPALLAGNSVLYKPSEYATLTGRAIAELLHESGIPREVFAVIIGSGKAGAALLQEDIDAVFFTGSYRTGVAIAEAVAPRMIRTQLELGGKDPAYVCEDVDVAAAAASLADGAFYNAGQSCCAVERIYVHREVAPAFVDAFMGEVRGFKVGDPMRDDTYLGPLARRAQLEVLEDQVTDAVRRGATLALGGSRRRGAGYYFQPTVLTGVTHEMKVMREESFGPIIGIQEVSGDEEALARMNDTEYGLTAAVYSRDRARAERLMVQVRTGTAYWNCCDRVSPRLPWSGRKHSGMGATLSVAGIRAFVQAKSHHLKGV